MEAEPLPGLGASAGACVVFSQFYVVNYQTRQSCFRKPIKLLLSALRAARAIDIAETNG